ncbi:MAG: hypothetical protein IT310_03305 [Anaerolineales bacterium]|nr:hypothetical protein [Anaerolineales bacterium]
MKILEIRRHSMRLKTSQHLSQEGVNLARSIGKGLGPFDFVATSTLTRALETAIAMGFAVNEQVELMNTYGVEVEAQAPWPMPFFHYSEIVKQDGVAAKYAHQLYVSCLDKVAQGGSVLAVNHGGVVELGVVACLPDEDFSTWGDEASHCEGARLYWENDKFIKGNALRVSK